MKEELTDEEIKEGVECMRWFQKNGVKLIEVMAFPTWPKGGSYGNSRS